MYCKNQVVVVINWLHLLIRQLVFAVSLGCDRKSHLVFADQKICVQRLAHQWTSASLWTLRERACEPWWFFVTTVYGVCHTDFKLKLRMNTSRFWSWKLTFKLLTICYVLCNYRTVCSTPSQRYRYSETLFPFVCLELLSFPCRKRLKTYAHPASAGFSESQTNGKRDIIEWDRIL